MNKIILCLFIIIPFFTIKSKEPNVPTYILIILDASNSMNGIWENTSKWQIAISTMKKYLDTLDAQKNVMVGLRVFGHQKSFKPKQDCSDTKLEVPFSTNWKQNILSILDKIEPKGTTPLAYSLDKSADDFPKCNSCKKIIVIITDGIEECQGDICASAKKLIEKGIYIRPFIIGIAMNSKDMEPFNCVGKVIPATKPQELENALKITIHLSLNPTTTRIFIVDAYGNPAPDSIPITIIPKNNPQNKISYIYTRGPSNLPEEIYIEPGSAYDVIVHTLPSVKSDSNIAYPGINNVWSIKAPSGYLMLNVEGASYDFLKNLYGFIKDSNGKNISMIQPQRKVRLLEGKYKIELNTLPPITIDSVHVFNAHTTNINIDPPGVLSITGTTLALGYLYKTNHQEYQYVEVITPYGKQNTFYLQPGNYSIIYRPINSLSILHTKEIKFSIQSQRTTTIRLD